MRQESDRIASLNPRRKWSASEAFDFERRRQALLRTTAQRARTSYVPRVIMGVPASAAAVEMTK